MKKQVNLSTGGFIMSALLFVIAGFGFYHFYAEGNTFWYIAVAIALGLTCAFALFYMPMSIEVKEKELFINRPLWAKRIPLSEIYSVRPCPSTMENRRICGSGGWFGYWGRFHASGIGNYFAYYGNPSDCFLLTLKNGRKYMLGCKDSVEMAEYISSHLS